MNLRMGFGPLPMTIYNISSPNLSPIHSPPHHPMSHAPIHKKLKFKSTICPNSKRHIQLCSFLIRGGKRITPIRFCGYASPKLHTQLPMVPGLRLDAMPTRHAEIGALNALTYKARQSRLLKKTILCVIRFIEPPPPPRPKRKKYKKQKIENEDKVLLKLACSRPCSECIKIICALRIKSVIYVNEENVLVNESPDCIEHCGTVHSGGTLGEYARRNTH